MTMKAKTLAPDSVWMDIAPREAAVMLLSNTHNRPSSQDMVDRYVADMLAGNWQPTHQGIAFDCNGVLLDGQQRLQAIVKSGKTIRMLVTTELPPESQMVMDRGRRRNTSQNLALRGVDAPKLFVAYINFAKVLLTGIPNATFTEGDLMRIHGEVASDWEYIRKAIHGRHNCAAQVGGSLMFAYPSNRQKIGEFIEAFNSGSNLAEGSPVLTAIKMVHEGLGQRAWNRREFAFRFLRCVEGYVRGEVKAPRRIFRSDSTLDFFYTKRAYPTNTLLWETGEAWRQAQLAEEAAAKVAEQAPTT